MEAADGAAQLAALPVYLAREMSGPRCVECGCNGCECAPPEEEPEYAFDDC